MATEPRPLFTTARIVLLVGVIMCILAAFGISPAAVNLFELGAAVCFASGLVP